jgi:hypothetical protein
LKEETDDNKIKTIVVSRHFSTELL